MGSGGLPAGAGAETGWASHRGAGEAARGAARPQGAVRGLGCHLRSPWAKGSGGGASPDPSSSVKFTAQRPQRGPAAAQGAQGRRAGGSHTLSAPHAPPHPNHCWGGPGDGGGRAHHSSQPCPRCRLHPRPAARSPARPAHSALPRSPPAPHAAWGPHQAAATPCWPASWQVGRGAAEFG